MPVGLTSLIHSALTNNNNNNVVWIYKGCNVLLNESEMGLKASGENETKRYTINIDSWSKIGKWPLIRSPAAESWLKQVSTYWSWNVTVIQVIIIYQYNITYKYSAYIL